MILHSGTSGKDNHPLFTQSNVQLIFVNVPAGWKQNTDFILEIIVETKYFLPWMIKLSNKKWPAFMKLALLFSFQVRLLI